MTNYLKEIILYTFTGDFGGNITTNILEVNVVPDHHSTVFICEATNEELQESVHNARTLSVKCKINFFQ